MTPAGWVVDSIHDLGVDVGSVIPEGFDAYVRLFHPAVRVEAGVEVPVRWAEIAAAYDRTFHAEMQWLNVSGVWEHSGETAPGLWDREPEVGTMPRAYAARLLRGRRRGAGQLGPRPAVENGLHSLHHRKGGVRVNPSSRLGPDVHREQDAGSLTGVSGK